MTYGLAAAIALTLAAAPPTPAADRAAPPPASDRWEVVARCGGFLEAPTRLRSGELSVSDPVGGRIFRIDDRGVCHAIIEGNDLPNGQALDAKGRLIVANRSGLMIVDPVTGSTQSLVERFAGEPLAMANDLSIDRYGGIYFTVPGGSSLLRPDGRVFYLPLGSREPELVAEGLAFPNGIAVAPDGNTILVAEFAAKRILSIPTRHSRRQFNVAHVFAHSHGGVGPDGLAFGDDGTLYAADIEAGTISRWSPQGQALPDLQLPAEAGLLVTNILVEKQWLYATEASQGILWRTRIR